MNSAVARYCAPMTTPRLALGGAGRAAHRLGNDERSRSQIAQAGVQPSGVDSAHPPPGTVHWPEGRTRTTRSVYARIERMMRSCSRERTLAGTVDQTVEAVDLPDAPVTVVPYLVEIGKSTNQEDALRDGQRDRRARLQARRTRRRLPRATRGSSRRSVSPSRRSSCTRYRVDAPSRVRATPRRRRTSFYQCSFSAFNVDFIRLDLKFSCLVLELF